MTAAAIQPPLISTKHQKSATIIFLHSKRMRSIQYIIVAICAVILFGTVLYFGIKNYEHKDKNRTKEETETFPVSKEPVKPYENVHPYQKEVEKGSTKKEAEKGSLEIIKFIQEEGAITESAGSIFLKSALKNMACSTTESLPLSISCCGQLLFSEDGSDKNHGCLIMDTYHISESEDEQQKYRLRFTMGDDLVILEEVNGFPKPGRKCYPIKNKSGKEICASINYDALDNNFSDTTGYNSCTFMNFGYGPELSEDENQLLGYSENIKCDIDKETIINKGLKSQFGVIIRLKLEPKTSETIKDGKESTSSNVNQTEIEDGDKQQIQNQNTENTNKELVTGNNEQNQNTSSEPEITNKPGSEGIIEIDPYFSGSALPSSEYSTDDTSSDEVNETFEHDQSVQADSMEPEPSTGFTSIFSTIINFIRDHILSVFVSSS